MPFTSKLDQAPETSFTSNKFKTWSSQFLNKTWYTIFSESTKFKKPTLILSYEDMLFDLTSQLLRIAHFLDWKDENTLERTFCAAESRWSKEAAHRRKYTVDYTLTGG